MIVEKMIEKSFGIAVRFFRERLGISQEELALRCGLHRTYISDIERGNRNVGLKNIEAIANGLSISLGEFFSEVEKLDSIKSNHQT